MKHFSAILFLLFVCFSSSAQLAKPLIASDFGGKPWIAPPESVDMEGSPFFNDKYTKATVLMKNNQFIENLPVKLNLLENKLFYLDEKGVEMESVMPVNKIIFTEVGSPLNGIIFSNGFMPGGQITSNTFLQVLDTGKVWLLQHHLLSISDYKPYGTNMTIKKVNTKVSYFVGTPSGALFGLGKEDVVVQALSNRKEQVSKFIQSNKLKFKNADDYRTLVRYYNALF